MTTQITHRELLDGYEAICNDLSTIVSQVRGEEIRWAYRVHRNDAHPVCLPADADSITLEYDRIGEIDFDGTLASHPANQRITDAVTAAMGDQV